MVLGGSACLFGGKESYVSRGEEYLKKRRFQEATMEFRSALEADRNYAPAHWGMARAYEGMGFVGETIDELRKTIEADPGHLEATCKLGNYYLAVSPPHVVETEKLLEDIFAANQNYIEGHILKASLFTAKKRSEQEVLEILNHAISLDQNRMESHLSLARYYAKQERGKEAEQVFQRALGINPNSALAAMEYGRFLEFAERDAEAEAKFRQAIQSEPENIEAREALAQFFLGRKQFDKAEQAYKELAEAQGNVPEGRATLAGFYQSVEREDEAVKVYNEILLDVPEFAFARYQLAEIFLRRQDYKAVTEQVEDLLSRDDRDMQAMMFRARVNLAEGKTDDAVKDLGEVLRRAPTLRDGLYFMVEAKTRAGQIDQSRTYIGDLERYHAKFLNSKLLKIQASFAAGEPNKVLQEVNELLAAIKDPAQNNETSGQELERLKIAAVMSRGLANLELKDYVAAREDLTFVQQASPSSPSAYLNLGRLAVATGSPAEALGHYEKAFSLDNKNFDALTGLVNTLNRQRQFGAAHARIDQVMQTNADNAKSLPALNYLKAQVLIAEGNQAAAEELYLKAIELDENYLPAYSAYASLLTGKRETDRAIEQYQKILAKRPDAQTFTLIALLEDSRQRFDLAETHYRKALELNPGMPIAANNLAWIIAESNTGNFDEALQLSKAAVDKMPANPGFYDTLGWVFHKKGLHTPAVENLKKAVALESAEALKKGRPVNGAYNLRLGIALASAGDKLSARKEVELALRNTSSLEKAQLEKAKSLLGGL
jgi:tetratricopeptide (TPR) repeat protein